MINSQGFCRKQSLVISSCIEILSNCQGFYFLSSCRHKFPSVCHSVFFFPINDWRNSLEKMKINPICAKVFLFDFFWKFCGRKCFYFKVVSLKIRSRMPLKFSRTIWMKIKPELFEQHLWFCMYFIRNLNHSPNELRTKVLL